MLKNWKLSVALLATYIGMHISSIFLGKALITYFYKNTGMSLDEATLQGVAWGLFTVNAIAAAIFLALLIPNKKYWNVFSGKKSSIGMAILWGVIGFFLVMAGQLLGAAIEMALGIKPGSDNTAMLSNIAKTAPIMLISIALFAPFLEEIIFRRVIFAGISSKFNVWIAAFASALIFASVHMELEHLLLYMMPGLVFSFLYYKTKRIITPMITHFIMNGFVALVNLNIDKIENFIEQLEKLQFIFFR